MNLLNVSPSPHVHSGNSISKLMFGVVLAMIPAFLSSVIFFGWGSLILMLESVLFCLALEYLLSKYLLKKEPTLLDGSALVTGVLLAFNLPVGLPVWIVFVGCVVSIGIAKISFGGLGHNLFNPALVGRVFLMISFPVQMTSKWILPQGLATPLADAATGATPLSILKEGLAKGESMAALTKQLPSTTDLFLGNMGGSMGEIAALAILLGLGYMLWKKIITWHIPISIIATTTLFAGALWLMDPTANATPIFHLCSGGLLLGAVFMATDYVTSPMSARGQLVYGAGIGILTMLIRVYGAYPEGVSFAILIMNAFTPLINKYIKPTRFGEEVTNG